MKISQNGKIPDLKQEVGKLKEEENKLKLDKVDVDQNYKTMKEKVTECNASLHQYHAKV